MSVHVRCEVNCTEQLCGHAAVALRVARKTPDFVVHDTCHVVVHVGELPAGLAWLGRGRAAGRGRRGGGRGLTNALSAYLLHVAVYRHAVPDLAVSHGRAPYACSRPLRIIHCITGQIKYGQKRRFVVRSRTVALAGNTVELLIYDAVREVILINELLAQVTWRWWRRRRIG